MHLCVSYIFSIFYSGEASEVKSKAQRGLFKDNTPVSATPVISDPVDNPLDDEGYDGFVISPSSAFASMSCRSILIYVYMFALTGQRVCRWAGEITTACWFHRDRCPANTWSGFWCKEVSSVSLLMSRRFASIAKRSNLPYCFQTSPARACWCSRQPEQARQEEVGIPHG